MTSYHRKPTQEQRILELLRERGGQGVYAYELTNTEFMRDRGGAIMQYNARVWGLRQKGYKIINDPIGHFTLYESEPEQLTISDPRPLAL